MLTMLTAAFILSGQAASEGRDPAELTRGASEAMHNFGATVGRCLTHLPPGAKERLDAGMARSDARTARERLVVASFNSGYVLGQADPSRPTLSVDQCNAMLSAAQGRVEASIAAMVEAGL